LKRITFSEHSTNQNSHIDIFLETDSDELITYECNPSDLELLFNGQIISITKKQNHRNVYLDFEGELSNQRGNIKILSKSKYLQFISVFEEKMYIQKLNNNLFRLINRMSEVRFESLLVKISTLDINNQKVQVLTFQGQINQNNAYQLSEEINSFFTNEIYNTILDLSKLEYINSIGLAALLSIIEKVEQNSSKILIGGLNSKIEIIIQLLDLTNRVEIHSSVEKAISTW
jgi:anti-anti-sigma factor